MKHYITCILTIFILNLSINNVFCQDAQIKIDNKTSLNLDVSKKSIETPENLGVWYPPPVENPFLPNNNYYNNITIQKPMSVSVYNKKRPLLRASAISLPVIVGGVLVSIIAKHSNNYILIPPIINSNQSGSAKNLYSNATITPIDEEKIFSLTIEDLKSLPLSSNGKLFIKLSDNINYKDNSCIINTDKLTDSADNDILFYDKTNKSLIINISNNKKDFPLSISFSVLVNNNNISLEAPFCLVKYTDKDIFDNIEWSKIQVVEEE